MLIAKLADLFELQRGGSGHNLKAMEGLRGFAVFLVFLVHYASLAGERMVAGTALHSANEALHAMGNVGVDLFFILSGYLIYGTLIKRAQPFIPFMGRRVERIYPAFLAVFAVYFALSFVFPAESKLPAGFGAASLYVAQNLLLLPGIFPIEPMITVAWSLSYEMFYYILIPLLVTVFALRTRTRGWRCVFFMLLMLAFLVPCTVWYGAVRLIMFVSGILLFEVLASSWRPRITPAMGVAALVAGILVPLLGGGGPLGDVLRSLALFALFLLPCYVLMQEQPNWLKRAFEWKWMRWLGNMSYSYYLLHGLTLKAGFLVLGKVLPSLSLGVPLYLALMGAMFAATLVSSAILFIAIERPFSLVRKQKAQAVTA